MKGLDMNKFKNLEDKVEDFSKKSGKYWEDKMRAQPDKVIVQLAKEKKELAQAEADRRGLRY